MRSTHTSDVGKLKLSEAQLSHSIHFAALLASILPPFLGGSVMALVGFYPIEDFYTVFSHWHVVLYILSAIGLIQVLARQVANKIVEISRFEQTVAEEDAHRLLTRLPWMLLIIVSLYSIGGVLNADIAIESFGDEQYSLSEHLAHQLGIVIVVIITAFPIYFYTIDRIARFLGPRGIITSAHPLWSKVIILGIITPLLIDSVIVGYYVNYTGYFGWTTIVLWTSLLLVAMGGTWFAWRSIRQGLLPLQLFVGSSNLSRLNEDARRLLVPLSMDELGVLTARYLDLVNREQQSALLSDAVMDNAGALMLVLDHEGRIIRFNRACEELSGYSFKEVLGKYPWDTVLPPEEAEIIRTNAFEALANNPSALAGKYSNDWLAKSGQRYRLDWSNTLLCNDSGKMEFMVSIGINVTEQYRAEEALRTNNQIVNAVLDTTPVLIAYLDADLNFVRVNKAYANADKKDQEYFIGKNHFHLFPNEQNEKIFRRVVESGESYSASAKPFEYENNPERGISHWDWTLTPIKDSDGAVLGLVLSLLDVSERINTLEALQDSEKDLKQANEFLETRVAERTAELQDALSLNQQILSTLVIGVSAYRDSGECEFANEAMERIIGASHEQILAQNFRSISSWKKYGLLDLAEKALKLGSIEQDEFHIVSSFGHEAWIDVTFAPFQRAGESHLLILVADITDRKKAEYEIIDARDQAQKANMAKNEFLSRMSHELRTPMNAILGFAQILEMEEMAVGQHDYVKEIHQAGSHLLELINELLDLSRIESGNLIVSMRLTSLNAIVSESIHMVQNQFSENEIDFINHCSSEIKLFSDPVRLRQVLVNLLSNAAKYNYKGGRVSFNCELQGTERLRVLVTNTGPGISEDDMDKLFIPFERLGAEYGVVDGTGIGLALSKQLVELIGGTIGVDSHPGEGTTFWVDLPMGDYKSVSLSYDDKKLDPISDTTSAQILYIEDNLANLHVIEALFKHYPHLSLLSATTGEFGIEQARRYHPDAILLDINLPGIDGYEVFKVLKNDPETATIPIIALSAEAMPVDIEKGLKAGFIHYLSKPVKVKELLSCLEDVIKK